MRQRVVVCHGVAHYLNYPEETMSRDLTSEQLDAIEKDLQHHEWVIVDTVNGEQVRQFLATKGYTLEETQLNVGVRFDARNGR